MNAGFANLSTLKSELLAGSLQSKPDWDAVIARIGLGTAAAFERICNRRFARTEGDTYVVNGQRDSLVVERFPIEAMTKIELMFADRDGWQEQDLQGILNWDPKAGIVRLVCTIGPRISQIRITYTGGYWWETAEPGEATSGLPAGATEIPADLVSAWCLQCRHHWQSVDRLGANIAANKPDPTQLAQIEILPQVKAMLAPYFRFSW